MVSASDHLTVIRGFSEVHYSSFPNFLVPIYCCLLKLAVSKRKS